MPDRLFFNARIADVITGREFEGWFTVHDGRFGYVEPGAPPAVIPAGFGPSVSSGPTEEFERVDLGGASVAPGLIDAHMHIESSLVTPRRFAEAALVWGTTTILQDPHEVANVRGAAGVRWMIRAGAGLPMRVYTAIPSCVPAADRTIETPNAELAAQEASELAREEGVLALGEMMDYQGVVENRERPHSMFDAARRAGLSVEGHVPSLSGMPLSRYIGAGVRSDHSLMTGARLIEKLSKGLYVMLQEKSFLDEVIETVLALPDRSRVLLVTDDVMPDRLRFGHMSRIVSTAVNMGWPALDAIASASLRPAVYLGLRDLGAVAPGYRADFIVCDQPAGFPPRAVYVDGVEVVRAGTGFLSVPLPALPVNTEVTRQNFTGATLLPDFFRLALPPTPGGSADGQGRVSARIVATNPHNTVTNLEQRTIGIRNGVPLPEEYLLLAVVVPRASLLKGGRPRGVVCLVTDMGLRRGAFATTFAHDSHNLFVIGKDPVSMAGAAASVLRAGGGMAVSPGPDQDPLLLELPIAGLLSDEPVERVGQRFAELEALLTAGGLTARNPILMLTILPLPVSPNYKITDLGIVDTEAHRILSPLEGS